MLNEVIFDELEEIKAQRNKKSDIEASINNECKKAVCCMVDGLFIMLKITP